MRLSLHRATKIRDLRHPFVGFVLFVDGRQGQHDQTMTIENVLPREMAVRAEEVGVTKARLSFTSTFALGLLGGAFISLGAMLSTASTAGASSGATSGAARLIAGITFSSGLLMVVVSGAELFTGNNLVVVAFASRRITAKALMRNWLIVYLANLVGALVTATLVFWSGLYRSGAGVVGTRSLDIAVSKSSLSFREAFVRGILANALVCLAVWMCLAARSVTDKAVAVLGPVTAFVATGLEHSVANMYFIPSGLLIKRWAPDSFWSQSGRSPGQLSSLTWTQFWRGNLVPVTLGNIIGGAGMVGIVYWFIYLRHPVENP